MITILSRIAAKAFDFFREPSEDQIDAELRRAFGLQPNIDYSIVDNSIVASGDTDSAGTFYVDSDGYLHNVDGSDEFSITNNNLYVTE